LDLALERYDAQAGNPLKMFGVVRSDVKADMQSRHPDNQILESDNVAYRRLLSLYAPGKLGNFKRHRMDNHALENTIRENLPPLSICFAPGAINAVRQFDNADSRDRYINFAMGHPRTGKQVLDALSAPFTCDQDAGIEN
jgi:hypothetical protein